MRQICTITLLICACSTLYAQKKNDSSFATIPVIKIVKEPRFLINIHSGYSRGLGSTFRFYPDDVASISVTRQGNNAPGKQISYANPTNGLGDGFKFGFGASYILNDFINVGLDFDYFKSTIRKTRDSSNIQTNIQVVDNSAGDIAYRERNTVSYEATLLSLTPSITFKAISRPKWFLYNKLGAVITFRPNSLQEDITQANIRMNWQGFQKDSSSTTIKKYEWGIRNPAYGFMGAFGAQIKVASRVRAYAEFQFSHIVFVIKKRTLTDFIVNAERLEKTFSRSAREVDFVKAFSVNATNPNPDLPTQTLVQRIPITYIGLQAGLVYQLR